MHEIEDVGSYDAIIIGSGMAGLTSLSFQNMAVTTPLRPAGLVSAS